MRHVFISSLIADAGIRKVAASADRDRSIQQRLSACHGSAVADYTRNILAALFGAVIGILIIFGAPAGADQFAVDTSAMSGFEVLTSDDGVISDPNVVIVNYGGTIDSAMVRDLRKIWTEVGSNQRFNKFVFRLNSPGGIDRDGLDVIAILSEIRQQVILVTLVAERDLCASMCVAVFIQGDRRYASPASAWMFHGASRTKGGAPNRKLTNQHFDLFRNRGIDGRFIDFLFDNEYVTTPGAYWVSGSELSQQSNIITKLLPNWKALPRVLPSSNGTLMKI